MLLNFGRGLPWVLDAVVHHFGSAASVKVEEAIVKAIQAGMPWPQIFQAVLSLLMTLFGGGTVSLQQIIDAILALIPVKP